MTDHVTVLSLGGGVQSTVLGLLCDRDPAFPTPDFAVHAVTGWDPPSVLERVEWLAGQVSYPVEIVQSRLGDIRDAVRSPAGPTAFVPILREGSVAGNAPASGKSSRSNVRSGNDADGSASASPPASAHNCSGSPPTKSSGCDRLSTGGSRIPGR